MLGAPGEPDTEAVRRALSDVEGVESVHHVHLWQIDERRRSVEAHLVVVDLTAAPEIVRRAKHALDQRFDIGHSTLEVEHPDGECAGPARRTA